MTKVYAHYTIFDKSFPEAIGEPANWTTDNTEEKNKKLFYTMG